MYHVYPPKFCITIVFDFSWGDCNTQEKLETIKGALRKISSVEARCIMFYVKIVNDKTIRIVILYSQQPDK